MAAPHELKVEAPFFLRTVCNVNSLNTLTLQGVLGYAAVSIIHPTLTWTT